MAKTYNEEFKKHLVKEYSQGKSYPTLRQVAIHANTYDGIYPEEISALQRNYSAL